MKKETPPHMSSNLGDTSWTINLCPLIRKSRSVGNSTYELSQHRFASIPSRLSEFLSKINLFVTDWEKTFHLTIICQKKNILRGYRQIRKKLSKNGAIKEGDKMPSVIEFMKTNQFCSCLRNNINT